MSEIQTYLSFQNLIIQIGEFVCLRVTFSNWGMKMMDDPISGFANFF